ncbi:MAG: beta-lactamase family protein [Prolixibacteraceae bacterium]|nr:beta-lactamase family protein [Prolixibacteraceae bacterium]
MKNSKYILLIFFLFVVIVAFTVQGLMAEKPEIEQVQATDEIPVIDYSLEIKDVLNAYDSLITSHINETGTVGAAVVITYKNQVAFLKCFGVQKKGESDLINENTVFRLASVSKTISGVLAGILDNEHTINLDDRIVDYLPGFRLENDESTNRLTVRNILSHTTGLVPYAYDNLVEEHVPFATILTRLCEVGISAPPGQLYGYQNVMFSLFDTITAIKTSKCYGDLINEKIFEPFHMDNASTGFEAFEQNPNKAYPHYGSNKSFSTLRLNDRYYSTMPAAGINASISDLANFMITILDTSSTVIDNNIRNTVFTPQVNSPLNRNYFKHWDHVKSKQYAIGWRKVNYKNRDVAYHGGYVQGYRAEIAVCMEENVGIAFLSNSPNTMGTKTVPEFLNLLFEKKDSEYITSL